MRAFYKNLKKVEHPFFSCFEVSTNIFRKKLKVKTVIHKNKVRVSKLKIFFYPQKYPVPVFFCRHWIDNQWLDSSTFMRQRLNFIYIADKMVYFWNYDNTLYNVCHTLSVPLFYWLKIITPNSMCGLITWHNNKTT